MNIIRLKDIKERVATYCKVISDILKIDVEIVDENLYRIAGTGIYALEIGKNIKNSGFVYSETIKKRKMQVIENPGKNSLCRKCDIRENCSEKMEVSYPIIYGDDIFGVIGLVCSDFKQKEILKKDFKSIVSFLEQMSELIAAKIIEQNKEVTQKQNLEFLKRIINNVNDGVIVIKNNNEIENINLKGLKELNLQHGVFGEKIVIQKMEDTFEEGNLYDIRIKDKNYFLVGKLLPSYLNEDNTSILIFKKLKKLKENAITLTYGRNESNMEAILGESKEIKSLKEKIKTISNLKSTVLITGESGTGKELVARAIHLEGNRKDKPFIAINCGAIPEALLESELFGYVKGAFSGADSKGRIGKFELANNGVIFLDEIGDMPLYLQVKLLRVLQERTIVKIGSNKLISLNLRVIAATNKDLKDLIRRGKFREDLYYRLNVIQIEVPPLREREGDLELLLKVLIDKYNLVFNKYVHKIEEDVLKMLKEYNWRGNVRELENVVEFMVSLSDEKGIIKKSTLPPSFIENLKEESLNSKKEDLKISSIIPLKEVEKMYIEKALKIYGESTEGKKVAAKKLGIGIATLYRKIESFNEDKE